MAVQSHIPIVDAPAPQPSAVYQSYYISLTYPRVQSAPVVPKYQGSARCCVSLQCTQFCTEFRSASAAFAVQWRYQRRARRWLRNSSPPLLSDLDKCHMVVSHNSIFIQPIDNLLIICWGTLMVISLHLGGIRGGQLG